MLSDTLCQHAIASWKALVKKEFPKTVLYEEHGNNYQSTHGVECHALHAQDWSIATQLERSGLRTWEEYKAEAFRLIDKYSVDKITLFEGCACTREAFILADGSVIEVSVADGPAEVSTWDTQLEPTGKEFSVE